MHSFNISYSVMGCLIYLAIVGIQLSSTWAGTVPLTCFLQHRNFFNIFNRGIGGDSEVSPYGVTSTGQYDALRVNQIILIRDGWTYNTTDIVYRGLNEAVIDDFGFNFNTNTSHITLHTDMLVTCHYISSGVLFSIPISGEGSCHVLLNNIQFGMIMPFNTTEESGQQFVNLRSFNYFYNVQDSANITLSNLYYGDHKSSYRMHHLMNKHWKFMTERYSAIFMDAAAEIVFSMLRKKILDTPLKGPNTC